MNFIFTKKGIDLIFLENNLLHGRCNMKDPIKSFWDKRFVKVKENLESNNFEVYLASDKHSAKELVLNDILPSLSPKSISWGGSMTFVATGLYDELKDREDIEIIDTYNYKLPRDQIIELRRKALLVDLFFTGTNAITEDGELVNLDMIGNRVGAITFGPKNVIILCGRNKIVQDLESAMVRIKDFVAPANAMRLNMKTPCVKTSVCEECKSPDRICNVWAITQKSYPKGRIKIVLINEELGL